MDLPFIKPHWYSPRALSTNGFHCNDTIVVNRLCDILSKEIALKFPTDGLSPFLWSILWPHFILWAFISSCSQVMINHLISFPLCLDNSLGIPPSPGVLLIFILVIASFTYSSIGFSTLNCGSSILQSLVVYLPWSWNSVVSQNILPMTPICVSH